MLLPFSSSLEVFECCCLESDLCMKILPVAAGLWKEFVVHSLQSSNCTVLSEAQCRMPLNPIDESLWGINFIFSETYISSK